MAIIRSSYQLPFGFWNKHIQTIFPVIFRKIKTDFYSREKIETPDNDFLILDNVKSDSKKCVILSHGLEGNSNSSYVAGMARYFAQNGFGVCAWNYRGCGDEMNKNLLMYHSGFTEDLHTVVEHVAQDYDEMFLIGFSIGGNISLKYLGENRRTINPALKGCVVFSVPVSLKGCSINLDKKSNSLYRKRFLRSLKEKIEIKKVQFPGMIPSGSNDTLITLKDFDNRYTAPLYGFENADDYYQKCSSKQFIPSIRIPTLIILAKNDPFLPQSCYPTEECTKHEFVDLEMPDQGGHVGFIQRGGVYWSEKRALEFIQSLGIIDENG